MPRLDLTLLGAPQIEHDGAPVKITQRKPLALAAYLGVTGEPHTRERLATLLWPDAEAERAFAYLRNALWQLNQTPVGDWIEADRETIALAAHTGLLVDVVAFREYLRGCQQHGHAATEVCPLCITPLGAAADLYKGDFMAGFSLGDSVEFDEWQFFQAENLRQAAAEALMKLTHYHAQQSPETLVLALDYARRWLALDPANEVAHRELMRLYAETDQRAAALRQYDACVRALKETLGTVPVKATVELYRQIRAGELGEQRAAVQPVVVAAPPAPTASSDIQPEHFQSTLPTPPTPFVGREAEVTEVCRLLAQDGCRLLSIVGPGGIGKTRLALEAARLADASPDGRFTDGVAFVPLAAISSPGGTIEAITAALNLSHGRHPVANLELAGSRSNPREIGDLPSRHILDYLADKRMLLVLDNLEHLIDPAAVSSAGADVVGLVEALLEGAPGVTLLVTTRERLNLLSEWVIVLSGMDLPAGTVESYEAQGAVQLFIQSARRAVVGFEPSTEELASIARICRLVQGFPLAIELAAAWVRLLPCYEIAEEIVASYDFLSTSLRDVPLRHRSLRAIFEHSWTLLPTDQHGPFSRLAVFRGGFTREAAREVAGASLLTLSSLIDKSLLQQVQDTAPPGGSRYAMHEVLRQYAEVKLKASGDTYAALQNRHSHYYLSLLHQLWPSLRGQAQKAALDKLDPELENIRTAWLWAVAHEDITALSQAALPLDLYCNLRSRVQEATELFQEAAETLGHAADPMGADRQALLGLLLALVDTYQTAAGSLQPGEKARRGLALLAPLGPRPELAHATLVAATLEIWLTAEETELHLREALTFYEATGDLHGKADALRLLGVLRANREDGYVQAEAYLDESLRLYRQLDYQAGKALALLLLGSVADYRGALALARQRYEEALKLYQDLGDPRRTIQGLLKIGDLARRLGEPAEARDAFADALKQAMVIGDRLGAAQVYCELSILAYETDDLLRARHYADKELALWQQAHLEPYTAGPHQRIGDTLLAQGDLEGARMHYEASLAASPEYEWAYLGLARVAEEQGDDDTALSHYLRVIGIVLQIRGLVFFAPMSTALKALIGVARVQARAGDATGAAETLGTVLADSTLHRHMRAEAETLRGHLADTLPPQTLEAGLERGRRRPIDAILADLTA